MKRFSSVILAAILLLVAATCSLGAVKNINGDFYSTSRMGAFVDTYAPKSLDTWYSITPVGKQLKLIGGSINTWGSGVAADYYLNDQTFLSLASLNSDGASFDNFSIMKGSYLFGFGFFVGLEYGTSDNDYNYYLISPGYRFSFGDDSYLALSVDYVNDSDDYSEIIGYELNSKYYTDMMKFYGQVYFPDESASDTAYLLGVNFQVADAVVLGLKYFDIGDFSYYTLGFTWTMERFILDFEYFANNDDDSSYELGGMFMINEAFGIGLGYLDVDGAPDAQLSAKFKYVSDSNEFGLVFKPENDTWPQEYYLTYTMKY
jgi:hypothetical protein